ncbi:MULTISPECIES: helix-turn-helix domain-containing protein [unclassified Streptomyces]|uniref:helix-turn-helix domain-containing protein n=1 Tax=unclassified Streptomyces TaxID=2593676 RepID=UPI0008238DB5|nr:MULTISPECIES: helix-turn-helix transcriptional regulator [unclassified Streptomyces]SCK62354.1 Cro/C1-type HTH DNA-binding domain-containing protein [Streptomyces sp. AmelKG-E11A]
MAAELDYHWHLRKVMADRGLFSTTDLIPLLDKRGITLSSSRVYRLVVERPAAQPEDPHGLLDILNCTMEDLIEPTAAAGAGTATRTKKAVGAEAGVDDLRPKRARIRGIERP